MKPDGYRHSRDTEILIDGSFTIFTEPWEVFNHFIPRGTDLPSQDELNKWVFVGDMSKTWETLNSFAMNFGHVGVCQTRQFSIGPDKEYNSKWVLCRKTFQNMQLNSCRKKHGTKAGLWSQTTQKNRCLQRTLAGKSCYSGLRVFRKRRSKTLPFQSPWDLSYSWCCIL